MQVGTAQPLFVSVKTSATATAAGTYVGNITLHVPIPGHHAASWTVNVPLMLTVHDVALPAAHTALTLWGTELPEWDGADANRRGSTGATTCNDTAFAELLLSHRMPAVSAGCPPTHAHARTPQETSILYSIPRKTHRATRKQTKTTLRT